MVVTIDGPAGSGKSTVSKMVAAALGFAYLDTGALYRAVALAAMEAGMEEAGEGELQTWLAGLSLSLSAEAGRLVVRLGQRDVEPLIRNEKVAGVASRLSALAPVRAWLLQTQRAAGAAGSLVAEGRDMGTVVFPKAEAKFFLTASVAERARRRHAELVKRGEKVDLAGIEREIVERDRRDQTRKASPLVPAPDAALVDTTGMTPREAVEAVIRGVAGARGQDRYGL